MLKNHISETKEYWRKIPGFDGWEASSHGRLRHGDKITEGILNSNGYRQKAITNNGYKNSYRIHRLVMLAFVGHSKLEVNHKNGIKSDNRLSNLEYVTRSENQKHAYAIGLKIPQKGTQVGTSKLKEIDIFAIMALLANGLSGAYIARKFKVSRNLIYYIQKRKLWRHLNTAQFAEWKSKNK